MIDLPLSSLYHLHVTYMLDRGVSTEMYKLTLASKSPEHPKVGFHWLSGMNSSANQPEMTQIISKIKTKLLMN